MGKSGDGADESGHGFIVQAVHRQGVLGVVGIVIAADVGVLAAGNGFADAESAVTVKDLDHGLAAVHHLDRAAGEAVHRVGGGPVLYTAESVKRLQAFKEWVCHTAHPISIYE